MSEVPDGLSEPERSLLERSSRPEWSSPMLATLTHKHFSGHGWIFERKFDGERALAFRGQEGARLLSRNRKDIGGTYPEIVDALAAQPCNDFIIDGEIVAFQGKVTSFSRLQQRMQIGDPQKARKSRVAVYFYAFDLLHLCGQSTTRLPLESRKRLLKAAIRFDDPLRYTIHRRGDGVGYLKEACAQDWEGWIAKQANSRYRHSRSTDWVKFKCGKRQEFVIGGFTTPKGSRKGFGALLVGYYQDHSLRYAGKVGTGYDDRMLVKLRRDLDRMVRERSPFRDDISEKDITWVSPKMVGEVGFTEWTDAGKLRHPRFLGLRRDKEARDVVREEARN